MFTKDVEIIHEIRIQFQGGDKGSDGIAFSGQEPYAGKVKAFKDGEFCVVSASVNDANTWEFDGWYDANGLVKAFPFYSFKVSESTTLTATWRRKRD